MKNAYPSRVTPHITSQHQTTQHKTTPHNTKPHDTEDLNKGPFYSNPLTDIDKPVKPQGCFKSKSRIKPKFNVLSPL